MPQLDFREALSTPEEKLFSPVATVSAIAAAAPVNQRADYFARGVGLSRSTWTNIVFVAIASVGGLVCAFYFFNGGELLRAAASWPAEFLYQRPLSTEKIDIAQQLNPVDQYARNETGSGKPDQAKAPSENNTGPSNFSQPATTIGSSNPSGDLTGRRRHTTFPTTALISTRCFTSTYPFGARYAVATNHPFASERFGSSCSRSRFIAPAV